MFALIHFSQMLFAQKNYEYKLVMKFMKVQETGVNLIKLLQVQFANVANVFRLHSKTMGTLVKIF